MNDKFVLEERQSPRDQTLLAFLVVPEKMCRIETMAKVELWRDAVDEALARGRRKFLIQASCLVFDSSGLGQLMGCACELNRKGLQVGIVYGNNTKLRDALIVTKLNKVFACFDDLSTALKTF